MSVVVAAVSIALVAALVFLLVRLDSWRPRRGRPHGRSCPNCGGRRVTAVVSDDRLDGMLECRACHRAWRPGDRP
ncbi:hypothetical protein F0L17_06585 [Streptomyces sp. TRM43335]|uniref:Uncharacterized protein n=1 Tax=Streptomyces taklimakanensis TaxID=2569853 RepID=A0A6G2B973_9ACTN|nr:hypothetical protein [Streptomyces taklimakanensis]MTE18807.1 hypothetical protein [Streptomyces taklimakanensis]